MLLVTALRLLARYLIRPTIYRLTETLRPRLVVISLRLRLILLINLLASKALLKVVLRAGCGRSARFSKICAILILGRVCTHRLRGFVPPILAVKVVILNNHGLGLLLRLDFIVLGFVALAPLIQIGIRLEAQLHCSLVQLVLVVAFLN